MLYFRTTFLSLRYDRKTEVSNHYLLQRILSGLLCKAARQGKRQDNLDT